ncbi:MAG: dihydrofolate reductase family protein [Actinophytocola sp.]|uniref:dihydrofolate reductase family protein n=1 Tax=Actinophytocola sp. TaxID=1872138 RepID=UPI003D6B21F5
MPRIVVITSLTLDGVMQAPGRADEDTRDGFAHGGWAVPYGDEVMAKAMGERMAADGALLLGRRTYDDLYGYWPNQPANPYTDKLNKTRKHVVSRTLTEPLPWQNSALVNGGVPAAVAALKAETDVGVLGSGELVRTLMAHDLVDEYLLLIHPLVLGAGRRLFPRGVPVADLGLVDSVTTTTGVLLAHYRVQGGAR